MQQLKARALSADADFMARLGRGDFHLDVHSRFSRVINLRCRESGYLYSVVCSSLDDAPNTLRISATEFDELVVDGNTKLRYDGEVLLLGDGLEIDLASCRVWLPPPLLFRALPSDYLQIIKSEIDDEIASINSISLFRYDGNNVFYQVMSQQLLRGSERLIDGMRTANPAVIRDALKGLLGLGIGLTPSGDDFLVGLCAVLAVPQHPAHVYLPLIAQVIRAEEYRTNKISYMALIKAVQGKTRACIGALLATIFNGELASIKERIKPVVNIGSSSGADILSGIAAGLLLGNHLGSQHVA